MIKARKRPSQQPNLLKHLICGFMGLFVCVICIFFGLAGVAISLLTVFGFALMSIASNKTSHRDRSHYIMKAEKCIYEREEQARIEYPEESYPDSLDADLIEFDF